MWFNGEPKSFVRENVVNDIEKTIQHVKEYFKSHPISSHRPIKSLFHDALQKELANLALEYGMHGYIEYSICHYAGNRNGYIDVAWTGSDGTQLLMEIDSSVRPKSVQKLIKANSLMKVWLYYGAKNPDKALVYDFNKEIMFLHIRVNNAELEFKTN